MSEVGVSDLDKVIPEQVFVEVASKGERIEIKNIKVKQLSGVTKAVAPFIGFFKDKKSFDVKVLLLHYPDEILVLLGIILGKDQAWFDDLEIDELIELITKVTEVNLDFFIQRVLPSVLKAMEHLKSVHGVVNSAGLLPSSDSSQKATDSPT